MVGRRLLGVLAVLGVVLLAGALPAQAGESGAYQANHHGNHHGDHHGDGHGDGRPSYPPKPPSISITKTTVMVGGTAVVMLTGCQPKSSASVVVTVGTTTVFTKHMTVNGAGQLSTPIKFTVKGTNLVTVTCGTLSRSVTVTVVSHTGRWGQRGHGWGDDEHGSGDKSTTELTRSIRLASVGSTASTQGDAVLLALFAGTALLLGTGSGLVLTSRRRRQRPRHAYTR